MRVHGLKLEKMEGTFSLLNSQLTVGTLSKADGTMLKGFTAGFGGGLFSEFPFELPADQALRFIACLEQVERKELPVKFRMRYGLWNLGAVTFSFNRYDPKWYGGGGVKGGLSMNGLRWLPIEMSMQAVTGLKECLQRFYSVGEGTRVRS